MTSSFFPKTTPQHLDLVLTLAADLFEASSKLPWPIHQYSEFIWFLLGNNHGPTLPLLSWKLRTPLYMDVSFCVVFTSKTLKSHQLLMAYNRYICNNPSSFNSPKLNKTGKSWLTAMTAWLTLFVRTLHPKEGGPSRYHGALAVCRKAERRNLGSWRWSQHPSPLNDTGIWRSYRDPPWFCNTTKKQHQNMADCKITMKSMGVLIYEID